jgi:hypothetical protein
MAKDTGNVGDAETGIRPRLSTNPKVLLPVLSLTYTTWLTSMFFPLIGLAQMHSCAFVRFRSTIAETVISYFELLICWYGLYEHFTAIQSNVIKSD